RRDEYAGDLFESRRRSSPREAYGGRVEECCKVGPVLLGYGAERPGQAGSSLALAWARRGDRSVLGKRTTSERQRGRAVVTSTQGQWGGAPCRLRRRFVR